jgi:integrase
MKLTAKKCEAANREKDGAKLFDGKGLFLELNKNGSKYWRYKYRIGGIERLMALGVYPEISLQEAREKHKEAHKLVKEGIDPNQQKRQEKIEIQREQLNTFEMVARDWHKRKTSEWSKTNADTVIQRLEKDVFPVIGKYPIKSIDHKMLLDLAYAVQERGANELAKRIIQMCKHIYQHAIINGMADKNIADDLKGVIKPKPKGHFAAIEANEIPQFIQDLRNHRAKLNRPTYLAVNMMMLTFVRTSELIKAEWDEFDFEAKMWRIPADRMKMKKDHLVPLSDQVIAILNELRDIHHNPKYIFPSRINAHKHMSNNTILMAIKRMGYAGRMTGHGFRALALSTIMEKLGYRHEVPDAQLAHAKKGDVNRAYDRAKFIDERIKMMQEWADYLDDVSKNNVISMYSRKLV